MCLLSGLLGLGGGCVGVAVSLTMILAGLFFWGGSIASFVQSGDVALIDSRCLRFLGVGG